MWAGVRSGLPAKARGPGRGDPREQGDGTCEGSGLVGHCGPGGQDSGGPGKNNPAPGCGEPLPEEERRGNDEGRASEQDSDGRLEVEAALCNFAEAPAWQCGWPEIAARADPAQLDQDGILFGGPG